MAGTGNCRSSLSAVAPAWCMAERTAISMASKSRCPDLRRPLKMTCNNRSTSRATSRRIASAVFFLGCWRDLLHGPQLADLFIDIQQLIAQFPEALALGDLALRFRQTGRRGKCFGDGFAIHLACQSIVGAVAGITGPMAVTVWISTTTTCSRNGARPQVTQLGDLQLNGGAAAFQVNQSVRHYRASWNLAYHYARFYAKKKKNARIVPSKPPPPPGPARWPASSPAAPTPKLISVAGAGRKRKW